MSNRDRVVKSKIPGLNGLTVREYSKRFHALKREANRAKNLTGDGKPRQRGFKHRYPDLDHLPPRERAVARAMRWVKRERYDKGLTQRDGRISKLERKWQTLRAEIGDVMLPEIRTSAFWERHDG